MTLRNQEHSFSRGQTYILQCRMPSRNLLRRAECIRSGSLPPKCHHVCSIKQMLQNGVSQIQKCYPQEHGGFLRSQQLGCEQAFRGFKAKQAI